ncbi:hypothetical protein [Ruegeria halocynthiae]|uniref:hypothetical protein n=1 Tax=Ruegeria halocynthiae TaxID=985054 RepID=UPI0012679251|nr:hypothetical protein [Ruegeria halocynthiae]
MTTISTARQYFDQVVAYNVQQYKAQPTSLPAAFNLASSLFSMHEWMWHTYGNALGANLGSARDFNSHVQTACPAFKHMRDLANASKHVFLSSPSTQAAHITDTSAVESRYGKGAYGRGKYGRGVVVIDDGGTKVDFENTADEVYKYWEDLLNDMGS